MYVWVISICVCHCIPQYPCEYALLAQFCTARIFPSIIVRLESWVPWQRGQVMIQRDKDLWQVTARWLLRCSASALEVNGQTCVGRNVSLTFVLLNAHEKWRRWPEVSPRDQTVDEVLPSNDQGLFSTSGAAKNV